MRLRCLAGAYAGQIRDYGVHAGLGALRSGTAERVDAIVVATDTDRVVRDPVPVPPTVTNGKRKKH